MTDTLRALTAEQKACLRQFRRWYGNRYKARIRDIWDAANPRTAGQTTLYCLRNTHGPSWLNAVRPADFDPGYVNTASTLPAPEVVDCPECKHELATGEPVAEGVTHSCVRPADFDNGGAT